jgi:hypothetical protein
MARTESNRRAGDAAARKSGNNRLPSNSSASAAAQDTRSLHFETCSKKGRGMARRSLDLIEAMHAEAKAAQPIAGRGTGYKLFAAGLIPSMPHRSTLARPQSRSSDS